MSAHEFHEKLHRYNEFSLSIEDYNRQKCVTPFFFTSFTHMRVERTSSSADFERKERKISMTVTLPITATTGRRCLAISPPPEFSEAARSPRRKRRRWWKATHVRNRMCVSFIQVARKLAMVEADLERAEERAEAGES